MIDKKNEDEKSNRIHSYISEITFNNGESISINPDDIVLFVGPNNVGKSKSLNDIYLKCVKNDPTLIIKKIKINKSEGSLVELIKYVSKTVDTGNTIIYSINNHRINADKSRIEEDFKYTPYYGSYTDLFVCKLTTENRLSITNPAKIEDRNKTWTNPIQFAAYNSNYAEWLSDNFKKAFGECLIANSLHGTTIPLCIGPSVKLNGNYKNEIERQNEYNKILESYKTVHTQGDGIKSFTGILLYLMEDYYSTYLIDEPESFLHPPQAKIMGQIIGNTLSSKQQAFISTHSEELVKGLLDVCSNRLKIIRITRKNNNNYFSILDNQRVKETFLDPIMKYSNLMSAIFHKTVVLCESDSDCKLYSVIEDYLKQKDGKYSETLFIHCGGKHRMAKTMAALKSLSIDVKIITDIDVLNDINIIKEISFIMDIDWKSVESHYNNIVCNLHSNNEIINRKEIKIFIENLLSSSNSTDLTAKEIKKIKERIKTTSKWETLKKCGKQAIPAGDAINSYDRLDEEFRKHNIYIVPVGELECFVKQVGGHGPEWVNNVLDKYPNLDDLVYNELREFIQSMDL